ncbi:hypothetical protein REPUB_Repub18cG0079900 [Reevesia pubescens]
MLYTSSQRWLQQKYIVGRAVGCVLIVQVLALCWLGDDYHDREAYNQVHTFKRIGIAGHNLKGVRTSLQDFSAQNSEMQRLSRYAETTLKKSDELDYKFFDMRSVSVGMKTSSSALITWKGLMLFSGTDTPFIAARKVEVWNLAFKRVSRCLWHNVLNLMQTEAEFPYILMHLSFQSQILFH